MEILVHYGSEGFLSREDQSGKFYSSQTTHQDQGHFLCAAIEGTDLEKRNG